MEKGKSFFWNISEVSSQLGLPTHVLRFWEKKFPQILPVKRAGGRRYYRQEDIELIKRIRCLLYENGYTIKGAQSILKRKKSVIANDEDKNISQPNQVPSSLNETSLLQNNNQELITEELLKIRDTLYELKQYASRLYSN